jgi:hypothetical protein
MWWWILHVMGVDDLSGPWYGFWSGFGADLGEIAIVGGLVSIYRRHNCHVKGCWRVGKHPVDGTSYVVCRQHHPDQAPTHQEVLAAHRAATKRVLDLLHHQGGAQSGTQGSAPVNQG